MELSLANIEVPSELSSIVELQNQLNTLSHNNFDDVCNWIIETFNKEEYYEELAINICRFTERRNNMHKLYADLCLKLSAIFKSVFTSYLLHAIDLSSGSLLRILFESNMFNKDQIVSKCHQIPRLYLFFARHFSPSEVDIHDPQLKKEICIRMTTLGSPQMAAAYSEALDLGYNKSTIGYAVKFDDVTLLHSLLTNGHLLDEQLPMSLFDGFAGSNLDLISASAYYGSPKVFKFLLLNSSKLPGNLARFSVMGGSNDIIDACMELGLSFKGCLETASMFMRPQIFDKILPFCENGINFSAFSAAGYYIAALFALRHENPRQKDSAQRSLLHVAASSGALGLAKYYISCGVHPLAEDAAHITPLADAARHGSFEIAKLLLENGADPNSVAEGGRSCLHLAAAAGEKQICRLLLKAGADPRGCASNGELTPLDVASTPEVKKLLSKYIVK